MVVEKKVKDLEFPLLGKIPLSKEIMNATDSGIPIVISSPDNGASKVYFSLADQISKMIKK